MYGSAASDLGMTPSAEEREEDKRKKKKKEPIDRPVRPLQSAIDLLNANGNQY